MCTALKYSAGNNTCSCSCIDVQTISGLKSLKINITTLLRTTSYNLLSDIQEITLEGWYAVKWNYGSCGVQSGVHSYIL